MFTNMSQFDDIWDQSVIWRLDKFDHNASVK